MSAKSWAGSLLAVVFIAGGLSAVDRKLSAGNYVSTLSPNVDEKAALDIEKQVFKISGLESIDVRPADSTLRFAVKKDASVDIAKVTKAVQSAAPGVSASEPLIESPSSTSGASGISDMFPSKEPAAAGTSDTSAPKGPGSY